jgi:hypothetical protein
MMNNEEKGKYGRLPVHVLPKSKRINDQIRQKDRRRRQRLTERLFYLFSGGHETEIDESGNTDASDRGPFELVDELERESEQVDPDGATTRIGSRLFNESDVLCDVLSDMGSVTAGDKRMTMSVWMRMWSIEKRIVQR